jgi:hypothetical protein
MKEDTVLEPAVIKEKIKRIYNPAFKYQNSDAVKVLRITEEDELLRIDFVVSSKKFSWVNMHPENFIRPVTTNMQLRMVRAVNIPISPDKHWFTGRDQVLYYTLYFPMPSKDVKAIDIIEREVALTHHQYFNFYGVSLERVVREIIMVNN